jgi:hypothetical protein
MWVEVRGLMDGGGNSKRGIGMTVTKNCGSSNGHPTDVFDDLARCARNSKHQGHNDDHGLRKPLPASRTTRPCALSAQVSGHGSDRIDRMILAEGESDPCFGAHACGLGIRFRSRARALRTGGIMVKRE